jgi:hypothetical protein
MKPDKKNKKPEKLTKKRESLKERVHRHLNDINSKITDDDIKNVKTELELRSDTSPAKRKNEESGENEAGKEDKQITPWNLLSEGYD